MSCCCFPCCLLNTLLKFIFSIIIALGVLVLILWLALRRSKLTVYVETASLTQFNLSVTNTLQYDLALNMSVRNPNKRVGIYYDALDAAAYYGGQRFGYTTDLPTFYQGHKNTTMLHPSFKGQSVVALGNSEVADFNREKNEGFFSVFVRVNVRMRFKVGFVKTDRIKPKFKCDLEVPLSSSTAAANGFTTTKCHVDI